MEERHKLAEISIGAVVDGRWKVERLISNGTFGTVSYEAEGTTIVVVPDGIPKFLHMEIKLLVALRRTNAINCPTIEESGEWNNVVFYITQALDRNLHEIRLSMPQKCLSLRTSMHVARQTLMGIEEVHKVGYVHRDIKPENMFVGYSATDTQRVYICGLELCRKYLDDKNEFRPFRQQTAFRGSPRYASVAALQCKEQGRVDDMWAWFQSMIECITGKLPFNDLNGPPIITKYLAWLAHQKEAAFNVDTWCAASPTEFRRILEHLKSLNMKDKPDYMFIIRNLVDTAQRLKIDETVLLDWQL